MNATTGYLVLSKAELKRALASIEDVHGSGDAATGIFLITAGPDSGGRLQVSLQPWVRTPGDMTFRLVGDSSLRKEIVMPVVAESAEHAELREAATALLNLCECNSEFGKREACKRVRYALFEARKEVAV